MNINIRLNNWELIKQDFGNHNEYEYIQTQKNITIKLTKSQIKEIYNEIKESNFNGQIQLIDASIDIPDLQNKLEQLKLNE